MRWFPTVLFPNSNPSSSSSPPPESACDPRKNNRSGWLFGSGKRLARSCRKVNNIGDLEALVVPPLSRSASTFEFSSASVQPQPLPLPRDANAATLNPPFRMRSVFASEDRRKSTEQVETRSTGMAGHQGQGDGFFLNIPARSAPTSPFESPGMSPNNAKTDDFVPYHYVSTKGNHFWSAPEMPTFDTSVPIPVFFDNIHSPHQSPRGKSPTQQHPRSPTGPSFSPSTIPPRLSLDTSIARRETINAPTVHPLPLPPWAGPGSLLLSPRVAKTESTPMKDQWQKGKLLGRGTFGTVYVATNRNTGALCAMKEAEIYADDPKSAECIKQLEQEIKVLSQLKHPNIVQYYGSEIVEDKFYIYLEYIHPGSINKYVREHCCAITESVVRNFTRHILSGLAYLHNKKTIHRDIKGANLLVDSAGVVKLADFGMAKHLTGHVADLSLKGSPYWMAPELLQAVVKKDNSSDLAFAVDIWSLGCTIIEMYTGKPPWSEYEGAAAMFKVMKDTPPIPETLSAEGKDFLRLCFIRNPAERPSASMLLEHRFLKNLQQSDVSSSMHLYHGTNLMDIQSPRDSSENKLDQIAKGKLVTESGILFV